MRNGANRITCRWEPIIDISERVVHLQNDNDNSSCSSSEGGDEEIEEDAELSGIEVL
jgi:hypothetical protein